MNLLAISLSSLTQPPYPAILLGIILVILVLYVYIAKAIQNKNDKNEAVAKPVETASTAKPTVAPAVQGTSTGNLELVNTDEKTAAVIMAIVSNKSGIPLERLQFKSITLTED